ncbi:MAG: FISUMP domain-containing protein, partial [Flavobacteriales bacterium]
GGKMKDNIQWNGTNSSGWSGLPGGFRDSGGFYNDGGYGDWWSASESGSNSWKRLLSNSLVGVYRGSSDRDYGFSARCVRD